MASDNSRSGILSKLRQGASLLREDLTGVDLSYVNFVLEGIYGLNGVRRCKGANFCGSNVAEMSFTLADLSGAIFSHAYLVAADFTEARLHSADFRCANLHATNSHLADLRHADFRGAD